MIDALITYLAALEDEEEVAIWATVDHAHDLEPLDSIRDTIPALYIFPGQDDASGDGTDSLVSHQLTETAHIALICTIETLDAKKALLRSQVIGWNPGPDEGYDDLRFTSGKLMHLKGGICWWEEIYTTWRTLREVYA